MFVIEMCRAFLAVRGGAWYGPRNRDFVDKCPARRSIGIRKLETEYLKIGILQKREIIYLRSTGAGFIKIPAHEALSILRSLFRMYCSVSSPIRTFAFHSSNSIESIPFSTLKR
jgi:hypothetical protein